jgi:N-acetylglutamate synthase-like GNAT family acetyltransferase
MSNVNYKKLTAKHFKQVIKLANEVHGEGYLNEKSIADWAERGISNGINCGYVALLSDDSKAEAEQKLIGFRITFSAEHWQADQWCSPNLWQVDEDKCCYFKCNTVDANYRGLGVGKSLLQRSIKAAKQQGALAGVAHLWKQSPNNSAVAYFTHCGGELVKSHPDKWNEESKQGYNCILCGHDCHCEAAEMIIRFE